MIGSNHTCEIIVSAIDKILPNNDRFKLITAVTIRGRITRNKIHTLFTTSTNSCFNTKAFHGIEPKLMPNVLVWIQMDVGPPIQAIRYFPFSLPKNAEHMFYPLTRVFELMPGYSMPDLYTGKKSVPTAIVWLLDFTPWYDGVFFQSTFFDVCTSENLFYCVRLWIDRALFSWACTEIDNWICGSPWTLGTVDGGFYLLI